MKTQPSSKRHVLANHPSRKTKTTFRSSAVITASVRTGGKRKIFGEIKLLGSMERLSHFN